MMKDNRRVPPPSNCISPVTFETSKVVSLIKDDGLRYDGRKLEDLRPINVKPGIVPFVTGSAYLECGNTKVMVSVNGPRDVLHKTDSLSKGQLYCEFKYALFSAKQRQPYVPTDEEKKVSTAIQEALEPVILLHKFPKARLDIFIVVLENDGSAISAAITCAGVALSNAGVEMYDLPVSCTLVNSGEHILIDPTNNEESYKRSAEYAKVILGMMPLYNHQVIYMDNSGSLKPSFVSKAFKTLQSKCQMILAHIKHVLKLHLKKTSESSDAEDSDTETSSVLKADELKLFQPQKYMNIHLENSIRPDGRSLNEFRSVLINIGAVGTANGSALVRLNNTAVLCGIKADLASPSTKEPNKGFFVPNVTLTPICSNKFQAGPPGELAQAYSQIIMELIKNSDLIDLSSLCIAESKLSWCLFVEMICLSHDGNIFDACLLAMMAALRNTKLPVVNISTEDEKIEIKDSFVDLKLNGFIFSASFASLNNIALADPTEEEENLASGTLIVLVKEDGTISTQCFGMFKQDNISNSIQCAKMRYIEMKDLIGTFN